MKENLELSSKIKEVVEGLLSPLDEISFALIDLKDPERRIAGYNMDKFIYPASIYKVFIAAEILRQVSVGERRLEDEIVITPTNEVDKNVRFFPKSTHKDYRPLLRTGDRVTLDYLLDLMLTRSDNTAANMLTDLADRENINNNIILPNGWHGSEVTRKFLDRLKEDGEYRISKITVSNAQHLVEFFLKVEEGKLVNEWVSRKLKEYMLRCNRDGRRKGLSIPQFKSYYRKGGWLIANGYTVNFYKGIKSAWNRGYAVIKYKGDAGVVKGENSHYAIAVLTLIKTKWPWKEFPLTELSKKIFDLMESRPVPKD